MADPITDPLVGTMPLSYAPLFVIRNTSGFESLERIASVRDLSALPAAELRFFDIRGPGGADAFAGGGPFAGDVLTFPDTSDRLSYWLQDGSPPYDTNAFVVRSRTLRASGTNPRILPNNRLQITDYEFKRSDRNRWIELSGFATPDYNGLTQILSYVGNTAIISKTTTTTQTGSTWALPVVEIEPDAPGLEPKYFPTAELSLKWTLNRGAAVIASGDYGGATSRWRGDPPVLLARSVRYTALEASNDGALALMSVIRNGVLNLQRAAAVNNTDLTPLITSTYGP